MSRERSRLLTAFAAVYIIWGSTYLAIRYAIETIPPFTMAGTRFLLAGAILVVWARVRGAAWPSAAQWRTAAWVGALLLLGGNGGVTWAEQRVPSALAALMVGAEPLWVVVLDWIRPRGNRPSSSVMAGLLVGFAGVVLLVAPWEAGGGPVEPVGAIALVIATVSWAIGSIASKGAPAPQSPLMGTGANMLAGSALLYAAGVVTGEPARLDVSQVSAVSVAALLYLVVFGAVVGFTAYLWLLKNTSLALASTYAYVNPVVAVVLGWSIAGEEISLRVLAAAVVILSGVVLITVKPRLAIGAKAPREPKLEPAVSGQ
ncbi:MAG TPA: EamA family transporter [Gemmatimonadales bacterium]|nr:EamA family transporter [Gemmatimonadales bacterium]